MSQNQRIALLALGGAGGKILKAFQQAGRGAGLDLAAADTCGRDLEASGIGRRFLLGDKCPDGTGGDALLGEKGYAQAGTAVLDYCRGSRLVIIVAPLGGGTACGGAPSLSRALKDAGIASLFVCTRPFQNEGNLRRKNAERCLEQLRDTADAVVCLEGDALFQSLGGSVADAFRQVDEAIAESIGALVAISRGGGAMPVDFSHLRTLLRKRDAECRIAIAAAAGEGMSTRLAAELKAFPMLAGSEQLQTCDAALLSLSAASDLPMSSANACISAIKAMINPQAEIVVGLSSQNQSGSVQAVLLLIRYAKGRIAGAHPPKNHPPRRHKTHASRSGLHESGDNLQGEFKLQELSAGAFSKSLKPTLWNGQNLDIPTWQRKGIKIENE
ncbi:MAG: hypothetical protein RL095_3590 [Verrucomicrobiota bacterium]|jgi:cell division protein FtsZ